MKTAGNDSNARSNAILIVRMSALLFLEQRIARRRGIH
jgi:hypothetical protein